MEKEGIVYNRYILSVPKTYTDAERQAIKANLDSARANNEDIIISDDIKVYPIYGKEEVKKDGVQQTGEQHPTTAAGGTAAPAATQPAPAQPAAASPAPAGEGSNPAKPQA